MNWGDRAGSQLNTDDPILHRAIGAHRPFAWVDARVDASNRESPLLSALGSGLDTRIIVVPVCSFLPYQAVVIAGGAHLVIDECSLTVVDYVCVEAFRRLFALGVIKRERPGDLSVRERRVVELSASGKTASEIAVILEISQRTVHTHLQNASEKLRARNKTHTVVEALRCGQISM
jgi:DNA-binding CsgD family transcriptional regulator